MKRRQVLLGLGAASAAGAIGWARPGDEGAPHRDYFRRLNDELQRNGPMRPCLVIDLDRLDHNSISSCSRRGAVAGIFASWRNPCRHSR